MDVDGISIERALEIENASIVDGEINDSGHLVLTNRGGTEFNAGQVVPQGLVPPGAWFPFAGAVAPAQYLMCDGAAVSRVTYSDLFDAIGTAYGVGDGATTFNVPNIKGRVPVGFNAAEVEFDTLAEAGGEKTHVLTTPEIPSHTHTYDQPNSPPYPGFASTGIAEAVRQINAGTATGATGGGGAHNNLQPYLVTNFIIKT